MTDRVLSTGEAKQAITKMQQIINGGLIEQIEALNREGQTLSRDSVWDGNLAIQFRGDWPQMYRHLINAKETLEELRIRSQKINEDIMTAGGNA